MNKVILLTIAIFTLSCQKDGPGYDLLITNVNVIDGTGAPMATDVNVFIKDGSIIKIDDSSIGYTENIIDGSGKYLIPGLFDCHVHTTDYGVDFPKLIHYGVTSVFIPGGSTATNDYYAEMRRLGSQDTIPAPRVFHTSQHFTMEGRHPVKTYASSNWVEGESVFYLRDTAQISELVRQVANYPIQGIKLTIEDGPAPPFVDRIPQEFINKTVAEASRYGLEVYAHVSDTEEFLMAVRGKATNLVHFVGIDIDWNNETHANAINDFKDLNGSIITTLMIDKSFMYPLNEAWLRSPALNEVYPQADLQDLLTPSVIKRAQAMAYITKSELGLDTLTLENIYLPQVEDLQRISGMGINVVLGTDTGNDFNFHGYSLHEEMQILEMGGMEPLEIIKMGTLNAARMMKVADSLGSVEVGKYADVVLLDANPLESIENTLSIVTVIKNGVIQERID